ncbi:hypothetical protein NFI96_033463 [Prochilodus magdalenae]|nr:hypothetical protein NFI96_033463 [Prochilodus magdalenae]
MTLCSQSAPVNWTANITESERGPWARIEKPLLVVILSIEVVLGVLGNGLVLCVKAVIFMWIVLLINESLFLTALICVQRFLDIDFRGYRWSVIMAMACLASWLMGTVFGMVPVIYDWVRYDPSEMLCAVFWESSYSDMLVYILCTFSISIFPPFIIMVTCSLLTSAGYGRNCVSSGDLSSVTPLLVGSYLLCYAPFTMSEVRISEIKRVEDKLILLGRLDLSPSPDWLRTFASVMAYLDCTLNPIIYCTNQGFREALLALLWNNKKSSFPEPVLTCIKKLEI